MISCAVNDFKAPIRALKFLNYKDSERIVAGEGNRLKIYTVALEKEFILPISDKIIKFVKSPTILYILTESNVFYVKISVLFDDSEYDDLAAKVKRISFNYRDRILQLYEENDFVWIASALGEVHLYSLTNINSDFEYSFVKSYSLAAMSAVFYSASFLRRSPDHLEIAFGTIFSGIQLTRMNCRKFSEHKIETKNEIESVYQISGHTGTIFDLMYHPQFSNLLISCSDDRTVRIWEIHLDNNTVHTVKCLGVCYGHEARVWSIDVNRSSIVSVSEDNSCRLWNLQGECLDILEADSNSKSLWSLAINDAGSKVLAGSNDGSICVYDLKKGKSIYFKDLVSSVEVFGNLKSFIISNTLGILYTTDTGHILKYSEAEKLFLSLHQIASISKYAEMVETPYSPDKIFIGDLYGNVHILSKDGSISSIKIIDASSSKVTKILPIDANTILVELNESALYSVDTVTCEVVNISSISYTEIKVKVVSVYKSKSAINLLFIGTRQGDLIVLNSDYKLLNVLKIFAGESLKSFREDLQANLLYILDHSGTETVMNLDDFKIIKAVKIGKGSYGSYHNTSYSNNLISYFNQQNFYLYDRLSGHCIEKIKCSHGGVRLWNLRIDATKDEFTFGYVINGKITVLKGYLDRARLLSFRSHGKEIRCATTIPNTDLFISGSEDGLLRLRSSYDCIEEVRIMNTSIKCISLIEEKELFFIGGSNETLQVFSYSKKSYMNFLSSCPKFCSIGEVRILNLDCCLRDENKIIIIIAGYSDSSIKVILFDQDQNNFSFIGSVESCHKRRCVQQIKILKQDKIQGFITFLSAGADGSLNCWSLSLADSTFAMNILWNISLHESGINALDCISLDGNDLLSLLVLTGGEDGTISLLKMQNGKLCKNRFATPCHNSTVTAIKFIDSTQFVSTSIDQRVILHKISDFTFTQKSITKSVISDIAAMTISLDSESENLHLTVYGVGQESFTIN